MIKNIKNKTPLIDQLQDLHGWKGRWFLLENAVLQDLEKLQIRLSDYHALWIREQFFYQIHQETGMDFGFCKYFIPAFRNRAESILTDNLKIDTWNKCTLGDEVILTTCAGTERDICRHLYPELGEKYDRQIKEKVDRIAKEIISKHFKK